ncbi:hypothetical protein ACFQ1M_14330 [Sungkyunkwania multivorans]|uniref:NlpE C-terminal OB domain-containing protein n=1 Tax=Sungkyunkwania multivorans TaxID=1173618 RepID=A0ABW3D3K8_9FLAO
MKNTLLILTMLLSVVSCKNEAKQDRVEESIEENLTTISGEFLYMGESAVLSTGKEVYKVTIDEKMKELDASVKTFKKSEIDFVPVTIKGIITPKEKDAEGWPFEVTIKEVVSVSPPSEENNTITIKSE